MSSRIAIVLFLAALPVCAQDIPRNTTQGKMYTLVNATSDSAMALAVAPEGSSDFTEIPLGTPLPGGLTSTTVRLPAGMCRRDFLVTFRDGRSSTLPGVNICLGSGLRLDARRPA